MTGVNESISIQETLGQAVNLMPAAKAIGVISGVRTTEKKNLELFKGKIGSSYKGIPIKYMSELSQDALSEALKGFSEQDIIIYLGYLTQPSGKVLSVEDSIKWIIGSTKAPVFGYWDFLIPYGVVGGKVVHGHSQGEAMGQLANRILAGEQAAMIPLVLESPNRFIFNDQALMAHGIDKALLPEETYLWRDGALNLKEYWNNEMAKALFGYEMFEAHGEMMWIIDAETGRILDANRAAKAYYGYPDLVGMDVGEINMLSDEAFTLVLESASSKTNNQFHFKHRLGDGRVIEVDVSSYPMDVGAAGSVLHHAGCH